MIIYIRNSYISQEQACKCSWKNLYSQGNQGLCRMSGNAHWHNWEAIIMGLYFILLSKRIIKVPSLSFNVFLSFLNSFPHIFPHGFFSLDCVFLVTSLSPMLYTFTPCFPPCLQKWASPLPRSRSRSLPLFEAWCAFPSSWMLTLTPFPSDVTEGWISMPPIDSKLNGSWLPFGLLANGYWMYPGIQELVHPNC